MTEIDGIVDELQREYGGDAWYGSSLRDLLKGVTAAQAATRPVPHAHSIWELVLHIAAWKREVASRMEGRPAGEPTGGDWPEAPSDGQATDTGWAEALEQLHQAQVALISAAGQLPPSRLHSPVTDPRNRPLGTGVSHYVTLHGVAQHDVYHAGQIAILKKALGS
ncbi:MAG: DinB family protein [Vicinamibacterales bacterium]